MGLYLTQTIGPYIKVRNEHHQVSVTFKRCSNSNCSNHSKEIKSPFCANCGSPQGDGVRYVAKPKVDFYKLLTEGFKESLYNCAFIKEGPVEYILPNRKNPNGFEVKEESATELNDTQKELDLKWFRETFETELKKLKEELGDENVSLHWGIISYSS